MVSPSNPDDETCGGILSKDFGFRPRCVAARAGIPHPAFSLRQQTTMASAHRAADRLGQ
jgi:hypothetical protein